MSSNNRSNVLDTSANQLLLNSSKNSNHDNQVEIAQEFHKLLYSILNSKPPVSKEKVNLLVKEALKSHRFYKHIVYYVESFIKNCPVEYKLSGLYVIDGLIRKHSGSGSTNSSSSKKRHEHIDLYIKRFSANICKTFNNLFVKAPQSDRIKINRVIELWQKYNVIEQDLIDKLNRIADTSKIDAVLSTNDQNNDQQIDTKTSDLKLNAINSLTNLNGDIFNELHKITSKLNSNESSTPAKKLKPSTPPPPVTTSKIEISKILEFDNDFDSDSDNQSNLKRKSTSPNSNDLNPSSIFQSTSERLKNSINSCTAWLQTSSNDQNIKLNDLMPHSYPFMYGTNFSVPPPPPPPSNQMPPPPPPPAPVPPPPSQNISHKLSQKEKEKERLRRGLPTLKQHHLCICSKTIWLGHLAKSTTEDIVIDEIIDLLSPSSSNDSESNSNKKKSWKNRNHQTILVDVHLIPPRGCAYVEFVDRKMASKCLDKMKDNYRLDGNYIKVAWATNKGIEKEKKLKEYWNVEVGCTYIPWSYLDTSESIDFSKWAIGGLVDEDSLPEKYLTVYKNQMLKLANSDSSISTKNQEEIQKSDSNDMDLDTDETTPQNTSMVTEINPIQQISSFHQNHMLNSTQVLPINFNNPPPTGQIPISASQYQALSQNQLGIQSIQVHPINFSHLRQFNPVFNSSQSDNSQESLMTPNQNLLDLLNSQRNIVTLAGPHGTFGSAPHPFQFIQRPLIMNPQAQNQLSFQGQQTVVPMRKILLPIGQPVPPQLGHNQEQTNADTSEISSTTQNEEKNTRTSEDRMNNSFNGNYQRNNWKSNSNGFSNNNNRRSYESNSRNNNYSNNNNNSRYSNRSNNNNNYNNTNKNSHYNKYNNTTTTTSTTKTSNNVTNNSNRSVQNAE